MAIRSTPTHWTRFGPSHVLNCFTFPPYLLGEIGLLSRPTRDEARRLQFAPDPKTWFRNVLAGPGIKHAPLTPDIAVDSSFLPGDIHGDPVDRLILATARHLGAAVVTRDRHIIQYGATGFVDVIAC